MRKEILEKLIKEIYKTERERIDWLNSLIKEKKKEKNSTGYLEGKKDGIIQALNVFIREIRELED